MPEPEITEAIRVLRSLSPTREERERAAEGLEQLAAYLQRVEKLKNAPWRGAASRPRGRPPKVDYRLPYDYVKLRAEGVKHTECCRILGDKYSVSTSTIDRHARKDIEKMIGIARTFEVKDADADRLLATVSRNRAKRLKASHKSRRQK